MQQNISPKSIAPLDGNVKTKATHLAYGSQDTGPILLCCLF